MELGNVYTHLALFSNLGVYENYAQKHTRREIKMD